MMYRKNYYKIRKVSITKLAELNLLFQDKIIKASNQEYTQTTNSNQWELTKAQILFDVSKRIAKSLIVLYNIDKKEWYIWSFVKNI